MNPICLAGLEKSWADVLSNIVLILTFTTDKQKPSRCRVMVRCSRPKQGTVPWPQWQESECCSFASIYRRQASCHHHNDDSYAPSAHARQIRHCTLSKSLCSRPSDPLASTRCRLLCKASRNAAPAGTHHVYQDLAPCAAFQSI